MLIAPLLVALQAADPKPVESLPPLIPNAQAISPDHKRIAIPTRDEGVLLLGIATKTIAVRVPPTASVVEYVTWSSDGAKLGLLHRNADIEIVDASTGAVNATLASTNKNAVEWEKREIHFAAGGTVIVAALGGPPTELFRCATGERIAQIVHKNEYYATAFAATRDGTRFALGTHEGGVGVWDAATGRQLAEEITVPLGISRRIRDLDFDSQGERLAIASGNCRVLVWTPASKTTPQCFSACGGLGDQQVIECVRFSPDGTRLLTTCLPDWFLMVWNVRSETVLGAFSCTRSQTRQDRVLPAWFSPGGTSVILSLDLRTVAADGSGARDIEVLGVSTVWWEHDGDYAWAVVDQHLVVRKIPDEQPIASIPVRGK